MPTDAKTRCDGCERSMPKAHAWHEGKAYCQTCYAREFVRVACAGCGRGTRSFHGAQPAYCKSCRNAARTCGACGKPLPRASRINADGTALCGPCAAKTQEPKPCALCGQLSLRLSRAPKEGIELPVCQSCRNSRSHFTCTACGKYRRPAGIDAQGRLVCQRCLDEQNFVCPQCKKPGVRHSASRCQACYWAEHAAKSAARGLALLTRTWTQRAYQQFSAALVDTYGAQKASHRVTKYLGFFVALDARFTESTQITVRELLQAFGKEGLRRNGVAVSFLIKAAYLPPATDWELAHHGAIARQEHLLERCRGLWYHALLERFRAHALEVQRRSLDRRNRGPKSTTIYTWLSAGERLLSFVHEQGIDEVTGLSSERVEDFLLKYPGYRASLPPFLRYLTKYERLFRPVKMPAKLVAAAETSLRLPEQKVTVLLRRFLDAQTDPKEAALGLLMLLYCQSAARVVRLRLDQLSTTESGRSAIRFAAMPIALDPDVETTLTRWLAARTALCALEAKQDNPYVFPGRRLGSHMDASSVLYYCERWGVSAEQIFATSLYRVFQYNVRHPNVPVHAFGVSKAVAGKYLAQADTRGTDAVSEHVRRKLAKQREAEVRP